jgi:hypothetical protein
LAQQPVKVEANIAAGTAAMIAANKAAALFAI